MSKAWNDISLYKPQPGSWIIERLWFCGLNKIWMWCKHTAIIVASSSLQGQLVGSAEECVWRMLCNLLGLILCWWGGGVAHCDTCATPYRGGETWTDFSLDNNTVCKESVKNLCEFNDLQSPYQAIGRPFIEGFLQWLTCSRFLNVKDKDSPGSAYGKPSINHL